MAKGRSLSFARLAFLLVAELVYPFAADTYAAIRTSVPGFHQGQRVSDSPETFQVLVPGWDFCGIQPTGFSAS